MHPDHVLRALGRCRDLVDVEIRRVRRQDRALFDDGVELAEHLFLDVHILVDRLDHEVAILEVVEAERRGQQAHHRLDLVGRVPALLGRRLVILADRRDAAIERVLRGLDDRDRDTGLEEVHRNPAAHRARADDADLLDVALLRVLGDIVDLGGLAFGEEQVALRGGLGPHHQFHEFVALGLDPLGEATLGRCLDTADVRGGRIETAELARIGFLERLDRFRIGGRGLLRRAGQRTLGRHVAGKGDRIGLERVLADNLVDQPGLERLLRRDRIADRGHFERQRYARDPRNPLGSAGTGEQAELHLGRPDLRRRHRDAVMTAQRHLAPAAQRSAVDRGDDGLVGGFDHVDHGAEARFLHRLAEFGDVRAREERASVAPDHDRLDAVVGDGFLDPGFEPLANRRAERVDGRVVRNDDEDVVMAFGTDGRGHVSLRH